MIIVKFASDWSMYAAGDEAAFVDHVAMGLQQKGVAMMLRRVDGDTMVPLEMELQVAEPAPPRPVVLPPAVDKRRKLAPGA